MENKNSKRTDESKSWDYGVPEVVVDQEFVKYIREAEEEERLHPSKPMTLDQALHWLYTGEDLTK